MKRTRPPQPILDTLIDGPDLRNREEAKFFGAITVDADHDHEEEDKRPEQEHTDCDIENETAAPAAALSPPSPFPTLLPSQRPTASGASGGLRVRKWSTDSESDADSSESPLPPGRITKAGGQTPAGPSGAGTTGRTGSISSIASGGGRSHSSSSSPASSVSGAVSPCAHRNFLVTRVVADSSGPAPPASLELLFFAERRKGATNPNGAASTSTAPATAHSIPLEIFRLEKKVTLPRESLAKSPFFKDQLDTAWKHASHVTVRLPRFAAVNSMMQAIEFLTTGRTQFERRCLFELLAVAHFLKLHALRHMCAVKIGTSLTHTSVIVASHFAFRCDIPWLMETCYEWILRNLLETGDLIPLLVRSLKGGVVPPKGLTLRQGQYSVPLRGFLPCYERVRKLSTKFCIPTFHRFVGNVVREDTAESNAGGGSCSYLMYRLGDRHPMLRAVLDVELGEYLICSTKDHRDVYRHTRKSVGSAHSNLAGTEFSVFNYGTQTTDVSPDIFPARNRVDLALVRFKRNILGTVPRTFTVSLRLVTDIVDSTCPLSADGVRIPPCGTVVSAVHTSSSSSPCPAPRPSTFSPIVPAVSAVSDSLRTVLTVRAPSDLPPLPAPTLPTARTPTTATPIATPTPTAIAAAIAEPSGASREAQVAHSSLAAPATDSLSYVRPENGNDREDKSSFPSVDATFLSAATAGLEELCSADTISSCLDRGCRDNLLILKNKEPVWSEALGAYTLDFGDAVKLPSKKNFLLIPADSFLGSTVLLLFGKVRPNVFHLEFLYPISPLQAFGIVLSSFDKKRLVT